jgi:hypothetical protein
LADHLTSVFQPHRSERKKPLPFNFKSLTNWNPRSAGSIDQKFKPTSATSNLKDPQVTTSSRAKSFRNYLPLASNIKCCHAHRILHCTMESSKDHPPLETWQTPQRTYVLQADEPFTHSI